MSEHAHLSVPGKHSRREFLRRAALLGGAGVAAPWALDLAGLTSGSNAGAADDYRALVCVFLYGGNDHNDTFVPYDAASHAEYERRRGGIARNRNALLQLDPIDGFDTGRSVAFTPEWSGLKQLFDEERLAIVANVGTLLAPLTKAGFSNRSDRPPQLFSHNDQQSLWQSSAPEGATTGWGGRLADLLLDDNGADSLFTCISVAGNAVMMSGRDAVQFHVSASGVTQLDTPFNSGAVDAGLDEIMRLSGSGLFPASYAEISGRALASSERLDSAIGAAPSISRAFPSSPLGGQLKMVARLIAAGRHQLGVKRQVFFVATGGFDNHDGLSDIHPGLLRNLDSSLVAFDSTMRSLGLGDAVTTFTASDFGRTLSGNGNGTDHGWGSHHIVIGDAVRGKRCYGELPVIASNGPNDVGRGRLLPTTAVEQYASTLARWMGASSNELATVVPNVGRFSTDDLGFMTIEPSAGDGGSSGDGGSAGGGGSAGDSGSAGDGGSAGGGGSSGGDGSAGDSGSAGDGGSAGESGSSGDEPVSGDPAVDDGAFALRPAERRSQR